MECVFIMNKRSVNIISLVILLSLLCFIAEVCIYYFVPQHYVTVIFSVISSLILSHYFLESSLNYDYNFIHASFMTITTLAFGIIVYIMQPNQWISFDFSIVILVFLSWFVPFIYCSARDLFDMGPRFDGYYFFFHRMGRFFIVIYLLVLIKQYFLTPVVPPYEELSFGAHDVVPFMSTATYIEETARSGKSLLPIGLYILELVCFGIPFGYYATVYLRRLKFLLRLFIVLAFPAIFEGLQYATGLGRCDIDDYVFFLIGTVIGIVLFHIMYAVFVHVANRDFTTDRVKRPAVLHFD